ncbi:MAG: phosphonopyruvate decarboxylase [Magnetococcales bacterium]|nr:phosphonopyruvate decarboxylase [Magnetococcales bacterium]
MTWRISWQQESFLITADDLLDALHGLGVTLIAGVPCAFLTSVIQRAMDDPTLSYIPAANEGDAVAMAAGAHLGGGRGVVLMQNSGLGNAVNPLTSLCHTARIPLLMLVTLRGDPDGPEDEPQHGLMGAITTGLLDLLHIPWCDCPADPPGLRQVLQQAVEHMDHEKRPYALVVRHNDFLPVSGSGAPVRCLAPVEPCVISGQGGIVGTRAEVLSVVQGVTQPSDLLLATTGYTGRELYALDDRRNQFYMVGSMGCVSSIGLGLALTRPDRGVVAIDGDGALIMRLGTLATIGHIRPANLIHLVLDNGQYESTGGQATTSPEMDFAMIAAGCGYAAVVEVESLDRLAEELGHRNGPRLLHIRIHPGTMEPLPRPGVPPDQVVSRFRSFARG